MLKNYFKIAFRNFWRNRLYSFLNVTGLSIGIATTILIMLWVQDELSYDRYHANADRIFRLERWGYIEGEGFFPTNSPPAGPAYAEEIPEIVESVRFYKMDLAVTDAENIAHQERVFFTDANLLSVFSYPLVEGDPATALIEPNSLVISTETATRYFGDEQALGRSLTVDWGDSRLEFKVTGIMEPMPRNSHFTTDFFASFRSLDVMLGDRIDSWFNHFTYVYFLLAEGADPVEVAAKLPSVAIRYLDEFARIFIGPDADLLNAFKFQLQPLTHIRLHSNLPMEIEPNGNLNTVILFSIVAVLLLVIACINFMNLATARATRRAREVGMRKVLGAYRSQLAWQFLGEAVLLALIALCIALALVELFLPAINSLTGKTLSVAAGNDPLQLGVMLILVLLVGCLAGGYPALFLSAFQPVKVLRGQLISGTGRAVLVRHGLVVFQFVVSIILIISTIVIYRQLNLMLEANLASTRKR